LEDVGLKSQKKQEILLFSTLSQLTLWPIQMHIRQVPGALTLVIKQQWYESENSFPHSAEVKNEWIHTSTPPYMPSWCVPGQLEVTTVWNYYGLVVTILRTCGYDHNCIESSFKKPKSLPQNVFDSLKQSLLNPEKWYIFIKDFSWDQKINYTTHGNTKLGLHQVIKTDQIMRWTGNIALIGKKEMKTQFLSARTRPWEDPDRAARVILKWTFKKLGEIMCTYPTGSHDPE